jgi:glutathione S-transferase
MKKIKKLIEGHQLYYFNTCPFCIKVRITLWRLGLKVPLKNIKTQVSSKAELIDGGGNQQVPCLCIESEKGNIRWLYESSDIIRYLKAELRV